MKEKLLDKSPAQSKVNMEDIKKQMEFEQASPEMIEAANAVVARESSNLANWKCHIMCFCLLACVFVVNMMRGSKKNPSIINIQKCGTLDWTLFLGSIIFYVLVFYMNVLKIQASEQIKKITKIGYFESDFEYKGFSLFKLVLASIGGGFAGAVGLGGGVVFNPVLIGLGV